jgi:glycosyltransferase involved in cell wall biosynthesis
MTTRKRLAVVDFVMSAGGVERVLRGLARAFLDIPEAREWDITFLLTRYNSARHLAEWPAELTGPNVRVEWLAQESAVSRSLDAMAHAQGVFGIRSSRIPAWAFAKAVQLVGPIGWRARLGDLYSLVAEASRRFDLMYFPYPFWMGAPPIGVPVVTTPQDFNFKFFQKPGTFARWMLERSTRAWLARADRVLLSSHAVEAELREFYPEHASKAGVVHLGIDLDRPAPSPEAIAKVRSQRGLPPRFVLVSGWVVPHKNQRIVIEAVGKLCAAGERLPIVFVGPNTAHLGTAPAPGFRTPYVEEVQTALREEGLQLGTDYFALGYVSDEEVQALLRLATVFVCPSTYEGFGLPGLEAMLARCPVILSRIPPLEEQNALLGGAVAMFDPRSAEGLAGRLRAILADPADTAAQAAVLSERVAQVYDWRKTARTYLEEFERLLARRSGSVAGAAPASREAGA